MTKAEVYKMVVDIQKESGQGLSGIVKLGNDPTVAGHLEELVEEGVVVMHDDGGSLGHPASNEWYMPAKGYNLWKDGEENAPSTASYRFRGGFFLNHVRLYLQCTEEDEGRSDNAKWLNPSTKMLVQDVDFMKQYSEWLERNKEELEIMTNLDDFYDEPVIELTDEEIKFVKSRSWYKDNKKVSECLKSSNKGKETDEEYIDVSNKLIRLYKEGGDKYQTDLEKTLKDVADVENKFLIRRRVHNWFGQKNQEANIQDLI